jgi:hypothetical protein
MNERIILRGKLQEIRDETRTLVIRAGSLIGRVREELALSAVTKIRDIELETVQALVDEAVQLQAQIKENDRHTKRLEAELGNKS